MGIGYEGLLDGIKKVNQIKKFIKLERKEAFLKNYV
jgi:hypothetical protein